MNIKKFLRQYKSYVISIGLIPLSLLVVALGIYPAGRRTLEVYAELSQTNEEIAVIRAKLAQLESLDEEVLASQLRLTTSAIPQRKDLPTLFTTVDQSAQRSGVVLSEISVVNPGSIATESAKAQTQEEKEFGAFLLPFSASLTGQYDQIISFMGTAENVRRFLRIRSFTMLFPEDSLPRMTVNFDAMYSPLPPGIVGGNAAITPLTVEDENLLQILASQDDLSNLTFEVGPLPEDIQERRIKPDPFSAF